MFVYSHISILAYISYFHLLRRAGDTTGAMSTPHVQIVVSKYHSLIRRTKASCRKDSRVEVKEKQEKPGVSYMLERKYNNNNNKEAC